MRTTRMRSALSIRRARGTEQSPHVSILVAITRADSLLILQNNLFQLNEIALRQPTVEVQQHLNIARNSA